MVKNLKINIKNTQIAEAINLKGLKSKLTATINDEGKENFPPIEEDTLKIDQARKKATATSKKESGAVTPTKATKSKAKTTTSSPTHATEETVPIRRVKAKSKSSFALDPEVASVSKEQFQDDSQDRREYLTKEETLSTLEETVEPSKFASIFEKNQKSEVIPEANISLENEILESTSSIEEKIRHPELQKINEESPKLFPPADNELENTSIDQTLFESKIKPVHTNSALQIDTPQKNTLSEKDMQLATHIPEQTSSPKTTTTYAAKLGPTGKHVNDLLLQPKKPSKESPRVEISEVKKSNRDQTFPPRERSSSFNNKPPSGQNTQNPRSNHSETGPSPQTSTNRSDNRPMQRDDSRNRRPPFQQQSSHSGRSTPRSPSPAAPIYTIEELAAIEEKKKAALKKRNKDGYLEGSETANNQLDAANRKVAKSKDSKVGVKDNVPRQLDSRNRPVLNKEEGDEEKLWRKRKNKGRKQAIQEDLTIRPSQLKIRLPITMKDLAAEMKLKVSQLLSKLFLQGVVITQNDAIDDATVVQLLGHEFDCEITIDTAEEERIRITNQTIKQEIESIPSDRLTTRSPIVAFMGHVDHGKTSLIDAIRKSNRVATEAGAITQHIGAFRCKTAVGDITILDTPGHEAFAAMRERGAEVTDIVILVISGEDGMRDQTIEAMNQAKLANVTIVVAINKCDKPNFNLELVYRQLAEHNLLPEAWGGETITVNCSAVTGEGIQTLLEMIALQSEVLELKANPDIRARGTVLESQMHKGMGAITTVLVQNGTLRLGDAVVFHQLWGKIKTMHDEYNKPITEAPPATPVSITGLSGLPSAGEEFIVVSNEKEARDIAEARFEENKEILANQKKVVSLENLMQQAAHIEKKVLNVILRTDVQGSLEALKIALLKIKSEKVRLEIVSATVGEISESDVELAATSKSVIIGFHTGIEAHAESIIRQLGINVRLFDIIYHAVEEVKILMTNLLSKIAEEQDRGKALVRAVFKSSHLGLIAGCQVTEGSILRNQGIRVIRNNEVIWKGTIASLKRVKEDVREVQKGAECGILLNGFSEVKEDDILQSFEVVYHTQKL